MLQAKDLRFEILRSSGPGGRHVNKRLASALSTHMLAALAPNAAGQSRAERRSEHHHVERGNAGRVFSVKAFVQES